MFMPPSRRSRLLAGRSDAITHGRVSYRDPRYAFLVSHIPHPGKAFSYLPVAADSGGRVGVAAAGNDVDDFDGFLAVPRDRAAQSGDLGGTLELDQAGASAALQSRRRPQVAVS
jgi:hypothetical protein